MFVSLQKSARALENDSPDWTKDWNETPQPFIWTKTAEQILTFITLLRRINYAKH